MRCQQNKHWSEIVTYKTNTEIKDSMPNRHFTYGGKMYHAAPPPPQVSPHQQKQVKAKAPPCYKYSVQN